MRIAFFALSVFLLFLAPHAARANTSPNQQLDVQAILTQQQQIRADADARVGRYKDLPQSQHDELYTEQSKVSTLLQGKTLTTDLPERDRIAVFNALEKISAIINQAEDDRLICERTKPVGSNRPVTQCLTVAQRREIREEDQRKAEFRDRNWKGPQTPDYGR